MRIVCLTSAGRVSQWSITFLKSGGNSGFCTVSAPAFIADCRKSLQIQGLTDCGSTPSEGFDVTRVNVKTYAQNFREKFVIVDIHVSRSGHISSLTLTKS